MQVDPADDSRERWVLQHFRYDPERRQRRNVTIAAYDDAAEFESAARLLADQVAREIAAGTRDDRETVIGVLWPPGYHAEARARRQAWRAISRPRAI